MGSDSELIRLEAYVERLLNEFSNLKTEKQLLEQELHEQQMENARLNKALGAVDSERVDVCDRVTSLIERLERWEAELESEPVAADIPEQVSADIGDFDPELEGEDGEEDPGGVQGSLFSAS